MVAVRVPVFSSWDPWLSTIELFPTMVPLLIRVHPAGIVTSPPEIVMVTPWAIVTLFPRLVLLFHVPSSVTVPVIILSPEVVSMGMSVVAWMSAGLSVWMVTSVGTSSVATM